MKQYLNQLVEGESLSREQTHELMLGITREQYNDCQIAALLMALQARGVTVDGDCVKSPRSLWVPIGAPVRSVLDAGGCDYEKLTRLVSGGPMMGKALTSIEVPICKGTNSVTILSGDEAHRKEAQPCIRCAKCVGACPMGLEPYLLAKLSAAHNWERDEAEDITSCIECGSCQFTCPAHRPLLDNIRLGKSTVMGIIRARSAKK